MYTLVLIDTVDEFEEHIYSKDFQYLSDAENEFRYNIRRYTEIKLYKGESLRRYAMAGVEYRV